MARNGNNDWGALIRAIKFCFTAGLAFLGPTSSLMSQPITNLPPINITSIEPNATGLRMNWTGGIGPFAVQQKANFAESWCTVMPFITIRSTLLPQPELQGFFRVIDMGSNRVSFATALSGGAQRPPLSSSGTGSGSLTLNAGALSFSISYSQMSGPVTAARIHGPATVTESASALLDVTPFVTGTITITENDDDEASVTNYGGHVSGSVSVTQEQSAALLTRLAYLNLCTAAHTNGEIRGQITSFLSGIVCPSATSLTNIVVSYLLDGWLISGNYGSGFWADGPSVFGPFNVRRPFSLITRANGSGPGFLGAVSPGWTSADPAFVTVTPGQAHRVALTIQHPGTNTVDVSLLGIHKTLTIRAVAQGSGLQVQISQQ